MRVLFAVLHENIFDTITDAENRGEVFTTMNDAENCVLKKQDEANRGEIDKLGNYIILPFCKVELEKGLD